MVEGFSLWELHTHTHTHTHAHTHTHTHTHSHTNMHTHARPGTRGRCHPQRNCMCMCVCVLPNMQHDLWPHQPDLNQHKNKTFTSAFFDEIMNQTVKLMNHGSCCTKPKTKALWLMLLIMDISAALCACKVSKVNGCNEFCTAWHSQHCIYTACICFSLYMCMHLHIHWMFMAPGIHNTAPLCAMLRALTHAKWLLVSHSYALFNCTKNSQCCTFVWSVAGFNAREVATCFACNLNCTIHSQYCSTVCSVASLWRTQKRLVVSHTSWIVPLAILHFTVCSDAGLDL